MKSCYRIYMLHRSHKRYILSVKQLILDARFKHATSTGNSRIPLYTIEKRLRYACLLLRD